VNPDDALVMLARHCDAPRGPVLCATVRRFRRSGAVSVWNRQLLAYSVLRGWRSLRGHGRFGEPEYQLLPFLLRHGDAAIDVGANLGFYTFRMAGVVGRAGRILAVEPLGSGSV
jgi:hypothetical protein